ncbi:hypothetical protein UA08_08795 [Talaromyces atroroseus]|uniref:Rhodopsin domain-containing protein n=1 Tax=Talaromyces atroroseus TaxID=1441469 RepID=A0A225ARC2_TALAT|nr:hypothetical protein UA08_08795 [Talaromyces atroroseus]OKL55997.1 hypothetical protein UA08_08795 [Talaromyces atroroseus]
MPTSSPDQAGCYAVAAILLVFSTLAVSGRLSVRRMKRAPIGVDDISISVSLLAYISQMISIVAYGALKLSVLFLFRRIFIGPLFSKVSLLALVIVSAWTVAFFFATLFQCGTIPSRLWSSPRDVATYCSSYKYIQLGHATSDVATDIVVLTIPMPIIWRLHMTTRQKLGLLIVFMLGYMSTAAATARIVFIAQDLYGEESNVMVWGYIEASIGVIAACLPTLRPLMKARMPESIVNSARSKLSLNSLPSSPPSRMRRVSEEELVPESQESYQLSKNGGGSGYFSTTMSHHTMAHAESLAQFDNQVENNLIRIGRDFEISQDSQDHFGAVGR